MNDKVTALVAPIVADLGLDLYDLDMAGGILKVVIDKPGGVDLEDIALVTRLTSRELDHQDPIPGRYTLEVTSPGVERTLRRPDHFTRVIGWTVAARTHPSADAAAERRVQGVLVAADDAGITVRLDGSDAAERTLRYDEIERAKTVFVWEKHEKPGKAGSKPAAPRGAAEETQSAPAGAAKGKAAS